MDRIFVFFFKGKGWCFLLLKGHFSLSCNICATSSIVIFTQTNTATTNRSYLYVTKNSAKCQWCNAPTPPLNNINLLCIHHPSCPTTTPYVQPENAVRHQHPQTAVDSWFSLTGVVSPPDDSIFNAREWKMGVSVWRSGVAWLACFCPGLSSSPGTDVAGG